MSNKIKLRHAIGFVAYGMFGCLGAYRGHQSYCNELQLQFKNKYHYEPIKKYYYITDIGISLWGVVMYMSPLGCVYCAVCELYNLEKYIRGIEDED